MHEITQHITNGDRLCFYIHPLGRDHDRQSINQITQNLKRSRPRPNDHGCPQNGGRDITGLKYFRHRTTATQMLAQVGSHFAQTTKINDPFATGPMQSINEVLCKLPIVRIIIITRTDHGMDKIIRGIHTISGLPEFLLIIQGAFDHCQIRMTMVRQICHFFRAANKAADRNTFLQQSRYQTPAHVTRRTTHKDFRDRHFSTSDAL